MITTSNVALSTMLMYNSVNTRYAITAASSYPRRKPSEEPSLKRAEFVLRI